MNKNAYRLIFSKSRGALVAVAEFTRSHRTGATAAASGEHTATEVFKPGAITLGLLLAFGMVQPVQATTIVADAGAPAGQRPTVMNNQVNIQTPSAAGVSRNVYSQFDVSEKGVVLNNSLNGASTQLLNNIAGNAALGGRAATIILNEVNSANPSQLNGMIEVAGQKAQVIIANPSGITCDGCGFTNASRATLTTGQAQLTDGVLTGYKVEDGQVVIQGKGLVTYTSDCSCNKKSAVDYTDIIARSVKVNAKVQAKDLKITTGLNKVDAANQTITKLRDDTRSSLDVAALGGMYADKITLVSTGKGVGVNNEGSVLGSQTIALNVEGSINNTGRIGEDYLYGHSTTNISVLADTLENRGSFNGKNLDITTVNKINNSGGSLNADNATKISGKLLNNANGVIAANSLKLAVSELSNDGGRVSVTGKNSEGAITEENALVLNLNNLENKGGTIEAGYLIVDTKNINNSAGGRLKGTNLDINSDFINNTGGLIEGDVNSKIVVDRLRNIDNGYLNVKSIKARVINNAGGNILWNTWNTQDDGLATVKTDSLDNRGGSVYANNITATNITNKDGVISGTGISINGYNLNNEAGKIAGYNVSVNVETFNNKSGTIFGTGASDSGSFNIRAKKSFDNTDGEIYSGDTIRITSNKFNNYQGKLTASKVNISVTDLSNEKGDIAAGSGGMDFKSLVIKADTFNNKQGYLHAGSIAIDTGTLANQLGNIYGYNESSIDADVLDNTTGSIYGGNKTYVIAREIKNDNGGISGSNMIVSSSTLSNREGKLVGTSKFLLNADKLDNSSGFIFAGAIHDENVLNVKNISNKYGEINSSGNLEIKSDDFNNDGGAVNILGDLKITAKALSRINGHFYIYDEEVGKDLPAMNVAFSKDSIYKGLRPQYLSEWFNKYGYY